MSKKHIKRIAAPRTWGITRKSSTYAVRPFPGAHPMQSGISLHLLLQGIFPQATGREIRHILQNQEVLVDGKRRKEKKHIVGPMDVISLPGIAKQYRAMISPANTIVAQEIAAADAGWKICKVTGKHRRSAKELWLHLGSGRNLLMQKDAYPIGDSVVIRLPSQEIVSHIPLQKGAWVCLTAGRHVGKIGTVEGIEGKKITVHAGDEQFDTLKEYAIAVGKDKPLVEGKG
ncbi:MAG TPA: S4 domain-containing protein [Candidatus Nanoarchaeia archaeon]|nr:S4 domain-containing protein [Candidatus Nanoarchaeia archaeon]